MLSPEPETPRASGSRQRGSKEISDLGIVLRSHKLGESDKILRIMTREHGKRSAVARGIRKTTSRFGGRLEPLTCARLLLHRGRNMDTVKQAEIQTSFREVREDLDLFVNASAMAELVDNITAEQEPHPELFDLFFTGLELLRDRPGDAPFIRAFVEFRVMASSGFELMVTRCAACGGALATGEVSFSLRLGGKLCESCRSGRGSDTGKLIRVGAETSGVLSWMATHRLGEWPESETNSAMREVGQLMDRVIEHWMERESRSSRVMKEIPG